MAVKKIITYPNPALREKTRTVTEFNEELKKLARDMADTMYEAPGAGLAANQIGADLRLMVIDTTDKEDETADKEYQGLVNAEITGGEGKQVDKEGCLSVIDLTAEVKRFQKISVKAQDLDGAPLEFEAEDFLARVIQHEVDHLNGILFIDHISSLKRTFYKKRLKKILKEQQQDNDNR